MAENMDELIFVKDLVCVEDINIGYGETQQIRDGEIVDVTKVNAHNISYEKPDGTMSTIGDALDELYGRL